MRALLLLLLCLASSAQADAPAYVEVDPRPVTRIAFGACNRVDLAQPLWKPIAAARPDVWIWTGDIVYADTADPAVFAEHYGKLKATPGYRALRQQARVLGVWDDHDYGKNNGGKEFAGKQVAQKALLDFLDEPAGSWRRRTPGVHAATLFGPAGQQVLVVLLDVRYFRDAPGPKGDTLGAAQWAWLLKVLRSSTAPLKLLVSGIQVLPEEHRYEKWANFPAARQRLFQAIGQTKARGVVFVSGDRHLAEISRVSATKAGYPLHEITSSGMTHSWADHPGEPNRHRVGASYSQLNFGMIAIDWASRQVELQVRGRDGAVQRRHAIGLDALIAGAKAGAKE